MTWIQIITSLIVIGVSTIVGISSFKDFNIIKKEAGFKFDANQALDKFVSSILPQDNKTNFHYEKTIQTLNLKTENLQKINLELVKKIDSLTRNNIQITNFLNLDIKIIICGALFACFTVFVTYKYLRLKKMHHQLITLANHQKESSTKLLEFYNFFNLKNLELSERLIQSNEKFNRIKNNLQANEQIKFDKEHLKVKIKKCCFASFNKSCRDFQLGLNCHINKKKLQSFGQKFENLNIRWYKNLINPSFSLSDKTNNSVLLLSILTSFILITYIDFHFPEFNSLNNNSEEKVYLTSSEGFVYDFLKIEDYIWRTNQDHEISEFNPFPTKTYDIGPAFDRKKNIMISNFDYKKKEIINF